ncbi:MAG: 7-cyano-7-deazaguanine synthase [Pirellulaceae bacterium]
MAQQADYTVHALSFRYGQRHQLELERATQLAQAASVAQHVIVDINLAQFGGSALTADIDVPKHESADQIGGDIPVTYVPARNTVFLSLAWPTPRASEPSIFSSASTRSTTVVIPIVAPSSSQPLKSWPTWPPRRASKEASH